MPAHMLYVQVSRGPPSCVCACALMVFGLSINNHLAPTGVDSHLFFPFLAALQNANEAAFIDFERSSAQLFAEA